MKLLTTVKKFSQRLFTKHLFVTNTTLGVFFFGAADVVQQNIEKRLYEGKSFEAKRTGNMLISGTLIGVAGHYWYTFLDKKFPGAAHKQVLKKVFLEMVIGPPVFLGFFIVNGCLEGKPVKTSFQEFKKNFLLLLAVDWAVYAPLQAINFLYLPPQYRFLYVCSLCFVYDIFLSYVVHKEDNIKFKKADQDKEDAKHL